MTTRQLLPDGIASAAPGRELACVLSGVDPGRLSGADTVPAMTAAFRQRNHADAVLLRCELEAGLAEDPDTLSRAALVGEFTGDEARAALGYSRTTANLRVLLAADLTRRLPQVYEAQYAGDLELAKAKVFSEWTTDTDRAVSDEVCRRVLPDAPRLTVATVQKRIVAEVLALDPGWADRRRAAEEGHARVLARRTESGTANLGGYDLPLGRVVPVMSRVEAVAARAKRGGAMGRIGWLRAEVFLGLLDGRWRHLSDDAIVADLIACHGPDDLHGDPDDPGPDGGPDGSGPGGGSDDGGPDGSGPAGGPDDSGSGDSGSDDSEPDEDGPDEDGPDEDGAGGDGLDGGGERRDGEQAVWKGRCRDGTVEIRAQLSTLLGLDDRPGEIAGWGPALPHQLRAMIMNAAAAQWRLTYTAPDGRLLHVDLTRRRPVGCRDTHTGTHGPQIVELQIPTTLLEPDPESGTTTPVLDPAAHPAWAAVIADARRRLAAFRTRHPPPGPPASDTAMPPPASGAHPHACGGGRAGNGGPEGDGRGGDAPASDGPASDGPDGEGPMNQGPADDGPAGAGPVNHGPAGDGPEGDGRRRRFARAELERWVRVRDRTCIGVACPAPAHRSDIDHTIDWLHHGRTDPVNLGAPCTHDHRLKHLGGWRLTQPKQGVFRWTTRTATVYDVTVPRVIPDLPETLPGRRLGPHPAERPATVDDGPGDPTGRTSTAWTNNPCPPRATPNPRPGTTDYDPDAPPPF